MAVGQTFLVVYGRVYMDANYGCMVGGLRKHRLSHRYLAVCWQCNLMALRFTPVQ